MLLDILFVHVLSVKKILMLKGQRIIDHEKEKLLKSELMMHTSITK